MVYQEQIMRILNRLGGIELSSAYACIKAISKKKHEIIDQRRVEFIQGRAGARRRPRTTAEEIFDLIVYFGGYGFNKSHTAAYAQVAYQTAYLKAHYTPEFMAALLSSEIEDGNKRDIMVEHIADARRLGVEVLPPDVNASDADFTVARRQDRLRPDRDQGRRPRRRRGDRPRRGEGGPFKDLFDFCERIDLKVVNKAALEKLIKAGAFDCLGGHRAQLLHALPRALQAAAARQEDRASASAISSTPFGGDGADDRPAPPRRCPTCRSGRRRKSSSTRRRSSTSTSPATRWPSARRSCAASPRHTRRAAEAAAGRAGGDARRHDGRRCAS